MERKKISIIGITYIVLLFIVYEMMLRITGFSINTAVYGLFAILVFFYSVTGNLSFREEEVNYNTVFINSFIFGIFFMFYKTLTIFIVFIVFSLFQLFIYRLIMKFKEKNKNGTPRIINERSLIKFGIDSLGIILGMIGAFMSRYGLAWENKLESEYIFTYLGIFLIGYFYTRMNDRSWSYTNILDVLNLIFLNSISTIVFLVIIYTRIIDYPVSTVLVSLILSISFQLFCRYLFRLKRFYRSKNKGLIPEERVLVYGAGEAGAILAQESMTNPIFPYHIVGFLDDDPKKKDTYIYNIKVLGNKENLEEVIKKEKVSEVLLALPSLHSSEMRNIVDRIKSVGNVEIKTVPTIAEILENRELASQLRKVKIEDLLGRDEIVINDGNIRNLIEGKVIFVTGGAGSIGSELSRQIARYSPKQLINIDINENSIYFLELEMKRRYPNLELISEICNVREKEKLEILFKKYRPNIVFHAAAHKHVPLMEHNPEEAIKNNIFGTKNVAECADKYRAEKMVLISTDKAVNPTNIMGASKRACELVIQHMNKISKNTKYMAVRFGNVLGSNGSVIPIFRKLLEEGKNLTLTHKDITRYFMTIPEAAQLVIEAGSLGNGGEIFILDMGKPVKIYDLAQTMIKLSNSDVEIDVVGLRPGEKLFEELLYDVNSAIKTENKKIFITKIEDGEVDITQFFESLWRAGQHADVDEIKNIMKKLVVSYKEITYL
ncbi:nucleoside-diphosphate sugar epimerase/dehydratase [Fusobacterium sp.]|uniref:polysaccharide biosynthesis protein n=1 Tax=Fusobacterium sp. TaxID=68766 RepID=UPI0028FE806B|nr:nucleoside-diphosphate sugar epimerase/dehydratase [Fusobacterium sp.]MDU1912150.1 nucleoside-diphosphate sugar epimerase/dehydratase [Fusobacterium sp.]